MRKLLFVFVMAVSIALAWVGVSTAMNVTLAWDPNSESDLAGYRMYYGKTSGGPYNGTGATQGNSPITIPLASLSNVAAPEYSVTNLTNETYFFVLTAYDTGGLESGYSNQVSASPPVTQYQLVASVTGGNGIISPASGTYAADTTVTLTATPNAGYRVLAWSGTANDTLKTNTNTVVMSANKTVTVSFEQIPVAPSITTHPISITKNVGETATFMVVASGTPPLTYRWESKTGTAAWVVVATGTSATYTTAVLIAGDNGKQFRCVITNAVGSVTSNVATLTVNTAPSAPSNVRSVAVQ